MHLYIFRSIKETNWLISKGMCVLLFDVFKGCFLVKKWIGRGMLYIYYWEKLAGKVNFSERKFKEMHQLWRAKRYKVYSGKRLFWHYRLQLSFVYKTLSQISFNLLCSRDKRLLLEFLRKWSWFFGHNKRFPKYLG